MALNRQALPLRRKSPREFLTAAQGRQLDKAFTVFIEQLRALDTNEKSIDWLNADESFRRFFDRQEDIILCNARRVRLLILGDVVETDGNWDRSIVASSLKATETEWTKVLEKRDAGFPEDTCTKLQGKEIQT